MEPELCSGLDVRSDADVDASHISEDTVPGDALASKLSGAIGRAVCVAMAESNNGNETCRRTTGVLVAWTPRILLRRVTGQPPKGTTCQNVAAGARAWFTWPSKCNR